MRTSINWSTRSKSSIHKHGSKTNPMAFNLWHCLVKILLNDYYLYLRVCVRACVYVYFIGARHSLYFACLIVIFWCGCYVYIFLFSFQNLLMPSNCSPFWITLSRRNWRVSNNRLKNFCSLWDIKYKTS